MDREKSLRLRNKQVDIYDCFKEYFGETLVDSNLEELIKDDTDNNTGTISSISTIDIIIRFPKVTITNENDHSVDITELYVKVMFDINGKLIDSIYFLRSEYTEKQWCSNYMHSHISHASLDWQKPCVGTGPIKQTMIRMRHSCDLNVIGLFCYELSKFVTVESLEGIPYKRLEGIGSQGMGLANPLISNVNHGSDIAFYTPIGYAFIKYYILNNDIPSSFLCDNIVMGMSDIQLWVNISNSFINWYNNIYDGEPLTTIQLDTVINPYYIENNLIYKNNDDQRLREGRRLQGTFMFKFKNKDVRFNLIQDTTNTSGNNIIYLINPYIYSLMKKIYLELINYANGDSKNFDFNKRTYIIF